MSDSLGVVIVHHDSLATLTPTVASVIASGVPANAVTVVDNSGAKVADDDLHRALPEGVGLVRTANRGYGAAVNTGLDLLVARPPDAVLVLTHEVLLAGSAPERLCAALDGDDRLGAVGPRLVTRAADGTRHTWSDGGILTPILQIPRHRGHASNEAVQVTDWLDGACCLYRWGAVAQTRFDEEYFLYFEEVDFHLQLRREGWRVAVVRDAVAEQSSNGTPGHYAAVNFRRFQGRWGRPWMRLLALAVFSVHRIAMFARHGDLRNLTGFLRGLVQRAPTGSDGRAAR